MDTFNKVMCIQKMFLPISIGKLNMFMLIKNTPWQRVQIDGLIFARNTPGTLNFDIYLHSMCYWHQD